MATAKLSVTRSKKSAADAQLRTTENKLVTARTVLKQSETSLSVYKAKLAQTIITSPIAGTIVFKALETGETVSPGDTMLTIVGLNHF